MRLHRVANSLVLIGLALTLQFLLCEAHPGAKKIQSNHQHLRGHALHAEAAASTIIPTIFPTATAQFSFSGTASPCSTSDTSCFAAPTPTSPVTVNCDAANGTIYTHVPEMDEWTIICNIDFPAQNIYPFVLAGSFESCLMQCEAYNQVEDGEVRCAGFVYAPERIHDGDDCYLKSALNDPVFPATIPLLGATLIPSSASNTASSAATSVPLHLRVPQVSTATLLGASANSPTNQYVDHPLVTPVKLAASLLEPGINIELITGFPLAGDTGSWSASGLPINKTLSNLSVVPHISRDGGKGGEVNGVHVFIFCDTAGYAVSDASNELQMVSFVSSSVATDSGMNGLDGKALTLVDHIGEWQDDVGRMRGLAPLTVGEESFNKALSGDGYRYAVWPESSLIPLNQTHSLLYASLVYDQVDMATQAANFTSLGNTLLLVSIDSKYGPRADRPVQQMFTQAEVSWGSLGGIRSWGNSGVGGMDGMVYLFGQTDNGMVVARTNPFGVANRSTFSYWDGNSWSDGMLPPDAPSFLPNTPMMALDVVYSPHHKTFIMTYLTPNADNTFYFRYLDSDTAILPPYAGGSGDYVENIVTSPWSAPQVLYKADAPPTGYIYAGGVHAGYFGDDDIVNGGTKMLLSWTQHTGLDAAAPQSGYAHMTAVVTFD